MRFMSAATKTGRMFPAIGRARRNLARLGLGSAFVLSHARTGAPPLVERIRIKSGRGRRVTPTLALAQMAALSRWPRWCKGCWAVGGGSCWCLPFSTCFPLWAKAAHNRCKFLPCHNPCHDHCNPRRGQSKAINRKGAVVWDILRGGPIWDRFCQGAGGFWCPARRGSVVLHRLFLEFWGCS